MIKYGNISKDIIREVLRSKNPNICIECDLGYSDKIFSKI